MELLEDSFTLNLSGPEALTFRAMSLTLLIILLSAGASLWAWSQDPEKAWGQWGFSPYRIRLYGEWYRFFTSVFFHADWTHLLLNALVFYSFGTAMERFYHKGPYLLLLGVGALASGAVTYWRYRQNPHHLSIGLSGVVNAAVFAFILNNPRTTLLVFLVLPMPAWLFALLYLAYSFYEGKQGRGLVNHWAHLGGALGGIIFAILVPGHGGL